MGSIFLLHPVHAHHISELYKSKILLTNGEKKLTHTFVLTKRKIIFAKKMKTKDFKTDTTWCKIDHAEILVLYSIIF